MSSEHNGIELKIKQTRWLLDFDIRERHALRYQCTERWHANRKYEVTIILQGSCRVDVEGTKYQLSAGQAILIPPDLHHIFTQTPGTFDRFCFWFSPEHDVFRTELQRCLPAPMVFGVPAEMLSLCHTVYREYSSDAPFWWDMQMAHLTVLLLTILRWLNVDSSVLQPRLIFNTSERATRIDRFIEANLSKPLLLDDLAQALHLSRRQTMRVVQEQCGVGFREAVLRARLDRAAWLLRTTAMPMNEIMAAVGYSVQGSSFSRLFRDRFNLSPRQYREQFRGEPNDLS